MSKWSEVLHPRGPDGKFKSRGAAKKAIAKHRTKAKKYDAKAAQHRAIAKARTANDRAYVKSTGDKGGPKDRAKLAKRNAKNRQKARRYDDKAYLQRAYANSIRQSIQTPAQFRRSIERADAWMTRLENGAKR